MIDPYQYTIYICEYQKKTWLKEIEDAKEMPEDWLPWRLSSKWGIKRALFIEVHEFFESGIEKTEDLAITRITFNMHLLKSTHLNFQ